jgi:hypothetical protein
VAIGTGAAAGGAFYRPSSYVSTGCGCSSGVEHDLAKVGVEGSNPFARSSFTVVLQSTVVGVSTDALSDRISRRLDEDFFLGAGVVGHWSDRFGIRMFRQGSS